MKTILITFNGTWTVEVRDANNQWPATQYATAEQAAARVLQLMDIESAIMPQTKSERVGVDEIVSIGDGKQHLDSGLCWCCPTQDYVNPNTGECVWVHHEPT